MAQRVLIADDAAFMREMLRDILTDGGYEVVGEASDGEEAVRMVAEKEPNVVLMDIWMPRLSGIEAMRRIEKQFSNTKVLALSQHDDRCHVEEALHELAATIRERYGNLSVAHDGPRFKVLSAIR